MFDIGWTELLVVGVVALLVVGPKELPALLRTIGRYVGMIKRQANEFRAQFDEAMRETELEQLRKEVASLKSEAESTLRSAEHSMRNEIDEAKGELDGVAAAARIEPPKPSESPEQPTPAAAREPSATASSVNGSGANGYNGAAADTHVAGAEQSVKSG